MIVNFQLMDLNNDFEHKVYKNEVPKDLKEKVMADVKMAKIVMDLTTKFPSKIKDVVQTVISNRNDKNVG